MAGEATIVSAISSGAIVVGDSRTVDTDFEFGAWKTTGDVTTDTYVHLRAKVPSALPSGTFKLLIIWTTAATSGDMKLNPSWVPIGDTESDGGSRTAEGVTTITASSGTANDINHTKITLDAATPVANDTIHLSVLFDETSWTCTSEVFFEFHLIWE